MASIRQKSRLWKYCDSASDQPAKVGGWQTSLFYYGPHVRRKERLRAKGGGKRNESPTLSEEEEREREKLVGWLAELVGELARTLAALGIERAREKMELLYGGTFPLRHSPPTLSPSPNAPSKKRPFVLIAGRDACYVCVPPRSGDICHASARGEIAVLKWVARARWKEEARPARERSAGGWWVDGIGSSGGREEGRGMAGGDTAPTSAVSLLPFSTAGRPRFASRLAERWGT